MTNKKKLQIVLMVLALLVVTGCQVKIAGIPFETSDPTLEKWEWLRDWIAENLVGNITYFLLKMPDIITGNENLTKFYKFEVMLLDLALVLVFMFQGLKALLYPFFPSLKYVQTGEFIKKMFLIAVFSNFAVPATTFLIQISNDLTNAILKVSLGSVSVTDILVPHISLSFLIFIPFYCWYLARLVWFWASRIIEIFILVACAPLIFYGWILPSGQKMLPIWWRQLTTVIFAQVFHAILLVVYYAIITGLGGTDNINPIIQIFLLIAMISFMINTPSWMRQFLYQGSGVPDPISTLSGGVKNMFIRAIPGGNVLMKNKMIRNFTNFRKGGK